MRTYTRKRPHYKAIEGVTARCRLCLGCDEVTVPIFGEDTDQLCTTLSLRIMMCVGLEMTHDNYLPNTICVDCYKELERYYAFRKKCEVTYQKLKAHVLAMKERHYNLTNVEPKKEEIQDQVTPDETNEEQLFLTLNENQQIQLVNLVNSNSIQLGTSENLFNPTTLEELSNEIGRSTGDDEHAVVGDSTYTQIQKSQETIEESTSSPFEVQASSSDLSLIMSTMLLELGVLRQEDSRLFLAEEDLYMVELEGADGTKVVLQLVEEDKEVHSIGDDGAKQSEQYTYNSICSTDIKAKGNNSVDAKGVKGNGKKDTTCPECHKRFSSRSMLSRHARVHSGARPYACGVCQRRFAQRAVLTRHELVHREKRPFACTSCPKSFTQRGALQQHARAHAPPHARALALHACAACDKVFLYASGLSRHMSVHTGRRFACAHCGRAFADPSALARHRRRHQQ